MLAQFAKFLVVVTLVVTMGAHWALLQSVAWTTMLASNLRTQSVTEAVSQTFDGNHPCPFCKAIAAAKKSEKKNEAVAQTQKMEFPPLAAEIILIAPVHFQFAASQKFSAEVLSQKPPVPPPRSFFI